MFEIIPFAYLLYLTLKPVKSTLKDKISAIKSKADPSIGEKLEIESVSQIKELLQTINYRPDIFDKVQTPEELLQSKEGDCEDFAVLTYSLLDYLGLNPGIAIAYTPGDPEAHAFVFYKCPYCENKYYIFSNKDFFEASSVEEAANMLGFEKVVYERVPELNLKKIEEVM